MKQHSITFANFICRFGEEKTLLDYAEQIVLPAFLDDKLVRGGSSRSHYHFYEVEPVILEDNNKVPVIGICGKFIKNTFLTREQFLDPEKGLVKDGRSLKSSPSAYFILILNNHRLIYFPETAHAPDIKTFKVTALSFIKQKHEAFINSLIKDAKTHHEDSAQARKSIRESNPSATLDIIPLTSEESMDAFLERFSVLKYVEIKLITPNDEFNAGNLFESLKGSLIDAGSENSKIVSRSKEGFKPKKVGKLLKNAAKTGNQDFVLKGQDENGNDLVGDADSFKIDVPLTTIPLGRVALTEKLYATFKSLIVSGAITIGAMPDKTEILKRIAGIFKDNG